MSYREHPSRGEGWWQIEYWPEGKKRDPVTKKVITKRETIAFQGNREAAALLDKELQRKPNEPPPITSTIRECVPDFLSYYKSNKAASNVSRFIRAWEKHLEPFFGRYKWPQLTQTIIESYKSFRLGQTYDKGWNRKNPELTAKKHPITKRTIQLELSYLSSVWKWAAEHNWCNPPHFKIRGFKAKQTKAPLPVPPTKDQMQRILDAMPTDRNKGDRKELFTVMYYAGLRMTEAYTLRAEKILIEKGLMFVTGKGGKERVIPIHPEALPLLTARVEKVQEGYLYPSPLTKEPYVDLSRYLKNAAKRAGVSLRVYQHLLRHGFGVHAIEDNINPRSLQLIMGHASFQTTEIYTRVNADILKQEMGKFGNRNKGPKRTEEDDEEK